MIKKCISISPELHQAVLRYKVHLTLSNPNATISYSYALQMMLSMGCKTIKWYKLKRQTS